AVASGGKRVGNEEGGCARDRNVQCEQPRVGQTATDSFSYTVVDSQGATSSTTVTITITGVNDAPVAVADTGTTDEDHVLNVAAPGVLEIGRAACRDNAKAVSQANGVAGNVGVQITLVAGAKLTVNANGSYAYDPNGQFEYLQVGQTASDSFSYTVVDSQGATSSTTVIITITGVNDAPVAVADTGTTDEDHVLNVAAPGVL